MKTTQKIFIINAVMAGVFLLQVAPAAAKISPDGKSCTDPTEFFQIVAGAPTCQPCGGTIIPSTPFVMPRTNTPAPTPSTCIMYGGTIDANGNCNGMRVSPGRDLINPASPTNGLGGNVFQAFWSFLTHSR